MQTGTVSIFGRGDDYQQVSMDYFQDQEAWTSQAELEKPSQILK